VLLQVRYIRCRLQNILCENRCVYYLDYLVIVLNVPCISNQPSQITIARAKIGHLVTLITCSPNQWALDFQSNADRILQSIEEAKAAGSFLRIGPELEVTGYGCLDHSLEADTDLHACESLVQILEKVCVRISFLIFLERRSRIAM
jgi:hypothetical protein